MTELAYETEHTIIEGHEEHGHHEGLPGTIGHVSPVKSLAAVLGTLLVLTVITVAVAQVNLGRMNVVVAIGIACVKASVVAMWFMHLRYDKRFNFWILIGSLAFVAWMVGYILFDSTMYQHNIREYRETHQIKTAPIPEVEEGHGHE
ncbi:MAG: cytochrome C oxidase subunit IV family protein [Planctomycetota bacterium]